MDHIPYPTHLGVSPIIVLYIDLYEFDGGDLATFAKRLKVKRRVAHQTIRRVGPGVALFRISRSFHREEDHQAIVSSFLASIGVSSFAICLG